MQRSPARVRGGAIPAHALGTGLDGHSITTLRRETTCRSFGGFLCRGQWWHVACSCGLDAWVDRKGDAVPALRVAHGASDELSEPPPPPPGAA